MVPSVYLPSRIDSREVTLHFQTVLVIILIPGFFQKWKLDHLEAVKMAVGGVCKKFRRKNKISDIVEEMGGKCRK